MISFALTGLFLLSSINLNAQCKKQKGERHAACSSAQNIKKYDTNTKDKRGKKRKDPNKRFVFELWQNKAIKRDNKPLSNSKNSNARYGIKTNYSVNAKWSNIYNALVRKAIRPGKTRTEISYTISRKKLEGNVFYGGYGWWNGNAISKDNLKKKKAKKNQPEIRSIVEFYVVENWGNYRPSDNGFRLGSYKVDNITYDLYQINRKGPTVYGAADRTFTQLKAIRRTKNSGSKGKIKMGPHFTQWSKLGKFKPGKLFEISFKLEGFYDPLFSGNTKSEFEGNFNATFKDGSTFRNQSGRKDLDAVAEETTEAETILSPNPTNGSFTASGAEGSKVVVYNLNGNIVATGVTQEAINANGTLSPGMYMVVVTNANGSSSTQKLIVQ